MQSERNRCAILFRTEYDKYLFLEELNWYILNHTEYLDDSFVSDDLIDWIARGVKRPGLAGQLKEAVRKK